MRSTLVGWLLLIAFAVPSAAADWAGSWVGETTDANGVRSRGTVRLKIYDVTAARDTYGPYVAFKCEISNDFTDKGRTRDCSGVTWKDEIQMGYGLNAFKERSHTGGWFQGSVFSKGAYKFQMQIEGMIFIFRAAQ